jgi:hypothetical protein
MAVRKCSKCCQLFRKFHGRALLVRLMIFPCLSMGPSRQRESISVLSRRAGSSGILWCILFLVKMALHRHRTGFEPQRWLTGSLRGAAFLGGLFLVMSLPDRGGITPRLGLWVAPPRGSHFGKIEE